jgi:hypothetical protein
MPARKGKAGDLIGIPALSRNGNTPRVKPDFLPLPL